MYINISLCFAAIKSDDPPPSNVPQADEKESYTKNADQQEIKPKRHYVLVPKSTMEDVCSISYGQNIRQRPQEKWQFYNREE
jgi:hypothetical protein